MHVVCFYYKKGYILLVSVFASVLLDWSFGESLSMFSTKLYNKTCISI
jgi:hypothetical protein